MTTWRKELRAAMAHNGDNEDNILVHEGGDLDREFNRGYGCTEGEAFTVWTMDWVYFPLCYDGSEWVGSAPRHPNGQALAHQGGG